MMKLPELAALERMVALSREVKGNAHEVTRVLASIQVTTDEELLDRWRPILAEGVERVREASVVLRQASEVLDGTGEWPKELCPMPLVKVLSQTNAALVDLLTRLECAKIDGDARGLLVRVRTSHLMSLPRKERQEVLRELGRASALTDLALQLEPGDA